MEIENDLKNISERVKTALFVGGKSYNERMGVCQGLIKKYSLKKNISLLDSTLYFANKGRDKFLRLQFLSAYYELLKAQNYEGTKRDSG
jgi:hypothetical protein